jgi:tRNA threonylcarbamoyladenosine biosynthesis protein TsaE
MNRDYVLSHTAEQTTHLGQSLARYLERGDILCLFGDLGSGKTTFVKGLAKGMGIKPDQVSSPTFVLMNAYESKLPLYHFDFYRLESNAEISGIGYDEFLYGHGVSVIEWAERFGTLAPKESLNLRFTHQGEDQRLIEFSAQGKHYEDLLQRIGKDEALKS